MMKYLLISTLCVVLSQISSISSARILGVVHYHGRSMFFVFESLMTRLADRGHHVTVISQFPKKTPMPYYTDIDITEGSPLNILNISFDIINNLRSELKFCFIDEIERCRYFVEHKNFKNVTNLKENFDLLVTLPICSDCLLGFAHIFNVPIISVSPNVIFPWMNNRLENPDNPAYIPSLFVTLGSNMNFMERMWNSLLLLESKRLSHQSELTIDQLARRYFGESLPPLWELNKKTSLILVNSQFSVNQPRPSVPGFVEVGGLHIGEIKPVPEDIDKFLNESKYGAVVFSFGSLIPIETASNETLNALLSAFSELPQRVLMKSGIFFPAVPDNVKVVPWLPQLDVLCHPNVIAFMTHGGFLGTQEAVYCGVPVVGTPFLLAHYQNINNIVKNGYGVMLEYGSITKEGVLEALRTVITNSSYREKAKIKSLQFRDRPQTPMETAIYWIEYVIRHGGAPHMRSEAVDLKWYLQNLLDVVMTLLILSVFCCIIFYIAVKRIMTTIRRIILYIVFRTLRRR